jgi:hypothetical protein
MSEGSGSPRTPAGLEVLAAAVTDALLDLDELSTSPDDVAAGAGAVLVAVPTAVVASPPVTITTDDPGSEAAPSWVAASGEPPKPVVSALEHAAMRAVAARVAWIGFTITSRPNVASSNAMCERFAPRLKSFALRRQNSGDGPGADPVVAASGRVAAAR